MKRCVNGALGWALVFTRREHWNKGCVPCAPGGAFVFTRREHWYLFKIHW